MGTENRNPDQFERHGSAEREDSGIAALRLRRRINMTPYPARPSLRLTGTTNRYTRHSTQIREQALAERAQSETQDLYTINDVLSIIDTDAYVHILGQLDRLHA